jgi:peptidase M50-like protein
MSTTCHRCGAIDPAGNVFRSERLPFRGTRTYCPKCHAKLEENFLFGILALNAVFGLIGFVTLWSNPASPAGHVFVNLFLIQFITLPSIIIHEFAHAIVGRLCGLTVLRIWIGRGKTIYQPRLLGFDTEFKMIPFGGLTFLTHGFGGKLRFRYFLAILAGPLVNGVILVFTSKYVSWRNFSLENAIQFPAFVALVQVLILVENLLPYRIQTALGRLSTDGLSLFQLLVAKSPDVLSSPLRYSANSTQGTFTR